jgi:CRISPR-associated endoribonuclease Cas6
MVELLSLVLSLRPAPHPDPNRPPPLWWGRAAHALLLKVVRQTDENLAEDLHDGESGPRPFTASTLIGYSSRRGLNPAAAYRLRLTALTAQVAAHLLAAGQPGGSLHPGSLLELDFIPFQVTASSLSASAAGSQAAGSLAAGSQAADSWAGQTSYHTLGAPYLLAKIPAGRQVSLELASPASWKSAAGMHLPLALPELVFGSLLNRWNEFAPITFPEETRRYAAECLAISRFELSSRVVPLKRGSKRIGCVGKITYTSLNYDRYWMSLIQTLADYAFYAGVGVSTAQGLGQCRRIDDRDHPGAQEHEPGLGRGTAE